MTCSRLGVLALVGVLVGCEGETRSPAPTDAMALRQTAPAKPGPRPNTAEVEPDVTFERQRLELLTDDGHALTLWAKIPQTPGGDPAFAVLLIHGRTWSSIPDFDLQVPGESVSLMDDLAAAGYAAYAIDLRGYGGTARDDSGWTTPERSARDVEQALAFIAGRHHLDRPPALFGWSNGSLVAQHVAQRRPELISDLILYGYPTGPHRTYADPETDTPARTATTAEGAAEDFITPTISDAVEQAFVEACLAADPVRADWRGLAAWNDLDPAAVKVPTLLIHGEHDPYARAEAHAAMMAQLGHGDRRWVVVPGGDHAAHLERVRGRFLAALVGFLGRRGHGR